MDAGDFTDADLTNDAPASTDPQWSWEDSAPLAPPPKRPSVSGSESMSRELEAVAARAEADAAESWRQALWLHVESAPRPLMPGPLLAALGKTSFDRKLLLAIAVLSKERGETAAAARVLELAMDDSDLAGGEEHLMAMLASRLYCGARAFDEAACVLTKALERFPEDKSLEIRELFVTLRSPWFDKVQALFGGRIERARRRGDRQAAARLNLLLGHFYEARFDDHFKAAECLAKAAALFMALGRPKATYGAQRAAVICLRRITPPPRQLALAVRALKTTSRSAGMEDDALALLASLQLDGGSENSAPQAQSPAAQSPSPSDAADIFDQAARVPSVQDLPGAVPFSQQETRQLKIPPGLLGSVPTDDAEAAAARQMKRRVAGPQDPTRVMHRPPGMSPDAAGQLFAEPETPDDQTSQTTAVRIERRRCEQALRNDPLSAARYRDLQAFYERVGRPERARLAERAAQVLEGRTDEASVLPQTLDDSQWQSLLHPLLQTSAAEIGALIGPAACEALAIPAGSFALKGPFVMDGSDAAWAMADAFLASVRVLGVRAGPIYLRRDDDGFPVTAIPTWPPAITVNRSLLRAGLPAPALRFFAARALTAMRPELQMYLLLQPARIREILEGLASALNREGRLTPLARSVVRNVSGKAADRLTWLLGHFAKEGLSLEQVCAAAADTAARAGLIASGSVAAAWRAMTFAGASDAQKAELLSFAVSGTYLALREKAAGAH